MIKPRLLTPEEVVFTVEAQPEHTQIKGNCSAIDPETDVETEKWIVDQLNEGNEWAWCCVKVSALWRGLEGTAYLGCCSYASKADFMQPDGYYDDLKADALADLQQQIDSVIEGVNEGAAK